MRGLAWVAVAGLLMVPSVAALPSFSTSLTDPRNDFYAPDEYKDGRAPWMDVVGFQSRQEGDQIIDTVTFAGARSADMDDGRSDTGVIVTHELSRDPENGSSMSVYWFWEEGRTREVEGQYMGIVDGDGMPWFEFYATASMTSTTVSFTYNVTAVPPGSDCFFPNMWSGYQYMGGGEVIDSTNDQEGDCKPRATEDEPEDETDFGPGSDDDGVDGFEEPSRGSPAPLFVGVLVAIGIAAAVRRTRRT